MAPIYWWDKMWSVVQGCTKVSPGCEHCGAEERFARFGGQGIPYQSPIMKVKDGSARWSGVVELREEWNIPSLLGRPCRIFVAGMGDLFHADVPDMFIQRVFDVMESIDRHQYLLLTKRIERARDFVNARSGAVKHIIIGTSVEDQKRADERIPLLCEIQRTTLWVNCEPLLGLIDLRPYLSYLSWVSWGPEETGPHLPWARPMDIDWARSLRDQCIAARVPFYAKDHDIDGVEYAEKLPLPSPVAMPLG